MKKLLLPLIVCLLTCSIFGSPSDSPTIKIHQPSDFTYISTGSFAWVCIPAGVNIGIGKRWYGEDGAFGSSLNLSTSLSVAPFLDFLLEGLYFIDSKHYVGLQFGIGVGKSLIKDLEYTIKEIDYEYKSPKWLVIPLIKFIPFGRESEENGRRQFMHFALFPIGVSFNYGWEI